MNSNKNSEHIEVNDDNLSKTLADSRYTHE